jgi:hypothetical protein
VPPLLLVELPAPLLVELLPVPPLEDDPPPLDPPPELVDELEPPPPPSPFTVPTCDSCPQFSAAPDAMRKIA